MKVTPTPAGAGAQRTTNRIQTWIKNNKRKIVDHEDRIEEAAARIEGLFTTPENDRNMILYAIRHQVADDVKEVQDATREIQRLTELNKNLAGLLEPEE